ncbi:MAG: putative aliphatic sulfonates transport permease protein SsuC, partial [Pseudomonadota bacterium]
MSLSAGATASLPSPSSAAPALRARGLRRHPLLKWLWAWPFPLTVLLFWHLSSVWGWAPEQVLPPPAQVFRTFADMVASGEIWSNLTISLIRVFTGFGIGLLAGLVLGS